MFLVDYHEMEQTTVSKLESLHHELITLRTCIPDVLSTIVSPDLYDKSSGIVASFERIATEAQKKVANFRANVDHMEDFLRSRESEAHAPINGTKPRGLSNAIKQESIAAVHDSQNETDAQIPALDSPNANGGVHVKEEASQTLVELPKIGLSFTIRDDNKSVVCEGKSTMSANLTRRLSSYASDHSREDVVAMIAAYRDIFSHPCRNCGSILSSTLEFPYIRQQEGPRWVALHSLCT